MIHFLLLISRQGKTRLAKWFSPLVQKERAKTVKEVTQIVLNRSPKLCNFVEWRDYKLVFKRYASLYFICCVDKADNELISLEHIHCFVEVRWGAMAAPVGGVNATPISSLCECLSGFSYIYACDLSLPRWQPL
eukprot:GHVU01157182.1.p2 GENE.GHVU01157182.1~~GHVU01157182.1.p2  ORF type:complete len:134 (+),score=13.59 GHVU01157182.1:48-449(+)